MAQRRAHPPPRQVATPEEGRGLREGIARTGEEPGASEGLERQRDLAVRVPPHPSGREARGSPRAELVPRAAFVEPIWRQTVARLKDRLSGQRACRGSLTSFRRG